MFLTLEHRWRWWTWWPPWEGGRGRTWQRWRWGWSQGCNLSTAASLFSLEVYLIGVGMNDDVFFIKPVVELLLVLVFPISSRQRRLLKLLEQMSMVRERGMGMWFPAKWGKSITLMMNRKKAGCGGNGFTWREFSSWGKSKSPEESILRRRKKSQSIMKKDPFYRILSFTLKGNLLTKASVEILDAAQIELMLVWWLRCSAPRHRETVAKPLAQTKPPFTINPRSGCRCKIFVGIFFLLV